MVRPYKVRYQKRRKREEVYDREEEEEESQQQRTEDEAEEAEAEAETEEAGLRQIEEEMLPGIPVALPVDQRSKPGAVFVLEKASLEVGKVGKTYQLLNSDDHANFLKRNGKNPADYRPDIAHQALLTILDSPLNKAGKVRAIYVRTAKGVLFEVKPHVRIPRTYKRFSGIMLQLLQKLSISAANKREKLLRTVKNPVTQYFPVNARKIGFSYSSTRTVKMQDYVAAVENDVDLVFVVGAMAHGKIDQEYTDDYVSISDYPLSAAWCLSKICESLQQKWEIF